MKVIEILKLGQNFAKALQGTCIKMSDFRYIELYDEYIEIVSTGVENRVSVYFTT